MTFDGNILWRDYDLSLCSPIRGTPLSQPEQVLPEVKTAGAIPLWLVLPDGAEILNQMIYA